MKKFMEGAGKNFAGISFGRNLEKVQGIFGRGALDDSTVAPIDVSSLEPQEAIAKLSAQNASLVAYVQKLRDAQQRSTELQEQMANLEAELERKSDAHRTAQAQHKANLERLQCTCEQMAREVERYKRAAQENTQLRAQVEEYRFRAIMSGAPEGAVALDTAAQWERMKASLVSKLQASETRQQLLEQEMRELKDVQRNKGDAGTPVARTAPELHVEELEAALRQSQEEVQQLTDQQAVLEHEVDRLRLQLKRASQAPSPEPPVPRPVAAPGWGDAEGWGDFSDDEGQAGSSAPGPPGADVPEGRQLSAARQRDADMELGHVDDDSRSGGRGEGTTGNLYKAPGQPRNTEQAAAGAANGAQGDDGNWGDIGDAGWGSDADWDVEDSAVATASNKVNRSGDEHASSAATDASDMAAALETRATGCAAAQPEGSTASRAPAEVAELLARVQVAEAACSAEAAQRQAAERELQAVKAQVQELKQRLRECVTEAESANQLRQELAAALLQADDLQSRLDEGVLQTNRQTAHASEELSQALARIAELEAEGHARTLEQNAQQQELSSMRQTVDASETQRASAAEHSAQAAAETHRLAAEVQEKRQEVDLAQRAVAHLEGEIASLAAKLQASRPVLEELAQLQTELSLAGASADAAPEACLQVLRELVSSRQELQAVVLARDSELASRQAQLDEALRLSEGLRAELAAARLDASTEAANAGAASRTRASSPGAPQSQSAPSLPSITSSAPSAFASPIKLPSTASRDHPTPPNLPRSPLHSPAPSDPLASLRSALNPIFDPDYAVSSPSHSGLNSSHTPALDRPGLDDSDALAAYLGRLCHALSTADAKLMALPARHPVPAPPAAGADLAHLQALLPLMEAAHTERCTQLAALLGHELAGAQPPEVPTAGSREGQQETLAREEQGWGDCGSGSMQSTPGAAPASPRGLSLDGLQRAMQQLAALQHRAEAHTVSIVRGVDALAVPLDGLSELQAVVQSFSSHLRAASREVASLQELNRQQEQELAIQWQEKQQLQSVAHASRLQAASDLALGAQQQEALRLQLEDAIAANEELQDALQAVRQEATAMQHAAAAGGDGATDPPVEPHSAGDVTGAREQAGAQRDKASSAHHDSDGWGDADGWGEAWGDGEAHEAAVGARRMASRTGSAGTGGAAEAPGSGPLHASAPGSSDSRDRAATSDLHRAVDVLEAAFAECERAQSRVGTLGGEVIEALEGGNGSAAVMRSGGAASSRIGAEHGHADGQELQAQLQELQTECDRLRGALQAAEAAAERAQVQQASAAELAQSAAECRQLRDALQLSQAEAARLQADLQVQNAEARQLAAECKQLQREADEGSSHAANARAAREEIHTLQQELTARGAREAELADEVQRLRAEAAAAVGSDSRRVGEVVAALQRDVAERAADAERFAAEAAELRAAAGGEANGAARELGEALALARKDAQERATECEQLSAEVERLQAAAEAAREVEGALAEARDQTRRQASEIERLAAEAEASKSAAAAAVADCRTSVKNLQAQLSASDAAYNAMKGEATQLQAQLAERQAQLEEMASKLRAQQSQHARELATLQGALEGANGRLERLQKLNKEKRAEAEHLQAQYAASKQAAAAAETALAAASAAAASDRAKIADLSAALERAHAAQAALDDIDQAVAQVQDYGPATSPRSKVQQMVWVASRALEVQEEAAALKSAAEEAAVLRAELNAALVALTHEKAAAARAQAELTTAIMEAAECRDSLEGLRAERAALQKQVQQQRAASEAEAQQRQAALDALPTQPPARWPASVRALVEQATARAREESLDALRGDAQAALAAADGELEQLRGALSEAADERSALQSRVRELEAGEARLREELRQQERSLMGRLRGLQAELEALGGMERDAREAAAASLQAQELQDQLQLAQQRIEQLQQEGASTRSRALELMREKDDELAALQQIVQQRGRSPEPVRAVSISEIKPASAALPSQPPAAPPSDAAPAESPRAYWKARFEAAQKTVDRLEEAVAVCQRDVADERRAHELRDLSDGVRKREMEELKAARQRSAVDVDYLKNVVVGFFESGELPANAQVIAVLSRLLHFTESDALRLHRSRGAPAKASSGVASFFGQ